MLSTSVKISTQLKNHKEKKEIINSPTGCDLISLSIPPNINNIDSLDFNSNAAYIRIKNDNYNEIWYVNRSNSLCIKLDMTVENLQQFDEFYQEDFSDYPLCISLNGAALEQIQAITHHSHIYLQNFFIMKNETLFLKICSDANFIYTKNMNEQKQPEKCQKKWRIFETSMIEMEQCVDSVKFLHLMPNGYQFAACDINGVITLHDITLSNDLRKSETEKFFLTKDSSKGGLPKELVTIITQYAGLYSFHKKQEKSSTLSIDNFKMENDSNQETGRCKCITL